MYAQQTVTQNVLTKCLTAAALIALTIALSGALNPAALYGASATLTWDAPTTNVDGTPLTDLAGYKVYYGNASRSYLQPKGQGIDVGNVTTYTVNNLNPGTWYFTVTAYDTAVCSSCSPVPVGRCSDPCVVDLTPNESEYSNEISKIITLPDTTPPSAPGFRNVVIVIVQIPGENGITVTVR